MLIVRLIQTGCITGTLIFGNIGRNAQSIIVNSKLEKTQTAASRLSKQESSVGIYFNNVAHDSRSNIWVSGSLWLLQGLLLTINGAETRVTLLPDITTVRSLTFTSPSNGWAIGDYCNLYATFDEGKTWRESLTTEANLTSICFIDALNGWVSGWHGNIYHTSDGGGSWSKQNSGTGYDLSKVTFVDKSRGWAIGGGTTAGPSGKWSSVLITSSDGGQTWQPLSTAPPLRSIVFVNASRGSGLDLEGNIYSTVDSGRTWSLRYKAHGRDLRSIFFLDASRGWAAGVIVVHTTDGGMSWSRTAEKKLEYSLDDVVFADRFNGWGISQYPVRFYRTMDGGETWLLLEDWKNQLVQAIRGG